MKVSYVVIQPSGILDGTKAAEFRHQVDEAIRKKAMVLLIDMQNVTFMDSSGLGGLVQALKAIRSSGGQLFVCSTNDQIKMLFELTSMDKVFTTFIDRQDFEKYLQQF